MIHRNVILEDLVNKLGDYRTTHQILCFPKGFRKGTSEDELNVAREAFMVGDTDYSHLGISGADWNRVHYETLMKTYDSLQPGEENRRRIREQWDAYRRDYPADPQDPEIDEQIIQDKINRLCLPPLDGFYSNAMEHYRQEFQFYLHEAILNAVGHGNKGRFFKKIYIDAWYGECGLLFRIKDEGKGFNVGGILEKLERGELHTTRKTGNGGQGLAAMYRRNFMNRASKEDYFFGFNAQGNEWMYLTLWGPRTWVPTEFVKESCI